MKWTFAFILFVSCNMASADDTLYSHLTLDFYRQYILHDDSTFTFDYNLQPGRGYGKGTYSVKGDDIYFEFDKSYTIHKVEQSKNASSDSVFINCQTPHEMFVQADSQVYRGYANLKIPVKTKNPILFQVGNEVIWLNDLEKGNVFNIEIVSHGSKIYTTNLDRAVLTEYREGFFKIKENHMFFAGKGRDISHRMKAVDYIRKK